MPLNKSTVAPTHSMPEPICSANHTEKKARFQLQARQFRDAVAHLVSIYKEHIRMEDDLVFPIAGGILAAEMSTHRR